MNNTQVGFQIHFHIWWTKHKSKTLKLFECSCTNGFTGDFCEFKAEQDHLLYLDRDDALVFNGDGKFVTESVTVDENSEAFHSCFTMLNGEAVIFGGFNRERQVTHTKP